MICKRVIDLLLATTGLIVFLPVMAVIALLLWIESPGQIIFAQERLGLHGRSFRIYKFRKFPAYWRNAGPGVTVAKDPRMTQIGRVLESTKLDELPQFWNILRGEMSLVGPRPESKHFGDLFKGKYEAVLDYLPGIFGPSQIAFRNESRLYPADEDPEEYYRRVVFPQKAELDISYFSKANCFTDFLWIIRGLWVSIVGIVNWQYLKDLYAKIIIMDIILIELAWKLAQLIRFWEELPNGVDLEIYSAGLWMIPSVLIAGMFISGCYRVYPLQYFCLRDYVHLILVVSISWMLAFFLLLGTVSRNVSLYLLPLGWLITSPALAFPRIWSHTRWEKAMIKRSKQSRRALIYGGGNRGMALASWIRLGSNELHIVGYIDDKQWLKGKNILGYRVLGSESDISSIHERYHIDEIWVTFKPRPEKRMRLNILCEKTGVELIILPEVKPFSRSFRDTLAAEMRN